MNDVFNLGRTFATVAELVPDREALVWGDCRLTYGQLADRAARFACFVNDNKLGAHTERADLAPHESGQDHVALYMRNGNAYLEAMIGAFQSRTVPINVNYRYVERELSYLFGDCAPRCVVYHAEFAPLLKEVLGSLPSHPLLVQVADDSGNALLDGAVDYEQALASADPAPLDLPLSPDDLYVLYTGGTTGLPKGVLWRQHDIFMAAMGGRLPGLWEATESYEALSERIAATAPTKLMLTSPFMHGAAQWASFTQLHLGSTIVLPASSKHLDAQQVLATAERERTTALTVIGDAVVRPLVEELERRDYDLSSLFVVANGSAPLTVGMKKRLLEKLPNILLSDGMGSSETGVQASHFSTKDQVTTGKFATGPGAVVLTADLSGQAAPGHVEDGWFAQTGWVPQGYLGDADKTARTFPVIDGVRYAVPGDRARLLEDGSVEILGRDSVTINSGGEKIFAEEVEAAISGHPAIRDVTVCGRPSERWGQEVVAVVELAPGAVFTQAELELHASNSIARYKLPQAWVVVPTIQRSPSGKPDYAWARRVAAGS